MAVVKRKDAPDRPLDASVQAHMDDERQRDLTQRVGKAKERTAGQLKKAEYDKDRDKITLDLPPEYIALFRKIATNLDVPLNKVVGVLAARGVQALADKELNIEQMVVEGRLLRWKNDIEFPELPDYEP